MIGAAPRQDWAALACPIESPRQTRSWTPAGDRLRPGDRIITGPIVRVPIARGDHVAAVVGEDALVTIEIA